MDIIITDKWNNDYRNTILLEKLVGESLVSLLFFEHLAKIAWWFNRAARISNLAWQITGNFPNLPLILPHQTFLLYSNRWWFGNEWRITSENFRIVYVCVTTDLYIILLYILLEPGHSITPCSIQWSSCYSEIINSTQSWCELIK